MRVTTATLPRTRQGWSYATIGAACGVLHMLAFAPRDWWWLEIAALAGLYALIERGASVRQAIVSGWAFGLGWFLAGIWWLYVSMHTYGAMPAPIAGLAVVLFAIYLALFPALAAGLSRSLAPRPGVRRILCFAAAWLLSEWLRGTLFTGFPWLASGYAHTDGPLAGYAPVVGMYGVSAAAAGSAALLATLCRPGMPLARRLMPLLALLAVGGLGLGLSHVAWTHPSHRPISVRLLQGDVPQEMKFERSGVEQAMRLYRDMIVAKPADLIVTPETAFPVLLQQIPDDVATPIRTFADATGSHILLGAVGDTLTPQGPTDFTNSLFGLNPGSQTLYRYDKHHLVPFGEFVPFGFRWFVDLMKIPLGDFHRGDAIQPSFAVGPNRIAGDICYEDLFGEEIARTLRHQAEPADVLVNASNLAWFGNTIALDQHLQIARMRSLETGRPMLMATNTGATAIIEASGQIQAALPRETPGVLEGSVQPYAGLTPYIRLGNWPALILAVLVLGAAAGIAKRSKTR